MNYIINKNKKLISITITLLSCTILLGLLYITFTNNNATNYSSVDFSDSRKEVIASLKSQSYSDTKIKGILKNIENYPTSLLKLADSNSEAIDFVYSYPKYKGNSSNISVDKYYTEGEIPLFLQWDKKWGYEKYGSEFIAIEGCAPTTLAMVAVGLTGNTNINPLSVSDYAYKNGYYVDGVGSSWSLISKGAENFGLHSEEIPLDRSTIISTLKSGSPVILTVGPGTFTSTGHFLVLTGVTSDGKITINDPNSKLNSSKSWDIDIFLNETKNLWKISTL